MAETYGIYKNCGREQLVDKILRVFRKQNEIEVEKIISIDNLSMQEKLDKSSVELVLQTMAEKDFPHGSVQRMIDRHEDIDLFMEKIIAVSKALISSYSSALSAGEEGTELTDLDYLLLGLP